MGKSEITESQKRQPYKCGAKEYLSSFNIEEIREYKEAFEWKSLRSIASKMKRDFGCQFCFSSSDGKKYIIRIK